MKMTLTGLRFGAWADIRETACKGNLVQLIKERNEHGTDGFAWRALCKGHKIGYMPELESIDNWKSPCYATKDAVRSIRAKSASVVNMQIVDKGDNWVELELIRRKGMNEEGL